MIKQYKIVIVFLHLDSKMEPKKRPPFTELCISLKEMSRNRVVPAEKSPTAVSISSSHGGTRTINQRLNRKFNAKNNRVDEETKNNKFNIL